MKALLLTGVLGAALTVSACAGDYYGPRRDYGYAPHQSQRYDAYYDGYYGDYTSGRWGDDGRYYYRHGQDSAYYRDDANHFRHDAYAGFHGVASADAGLDGVGAHAGFGVDIGSR